MPIKVIVDSTSYIPKQLIEKYDITVIPLSVVFEDEVIKETDITNEEFYEKLNKIPTSSQPTVQEIYNIFEKVIEDGYDIVGVFISSLKSGTYNTACMVKDMILENYPNANIELIDSKSTAMQLGYAALCAAKEAKERKTIKEVVEKVNENIKRSRFLFIPDTLEYLRKGGRIGTAKALLGSILQLKPILTVKDGKTDVITKVRSKKKAVKEMIDIFMEDVKEYGLCEAIIHHINCEEEAKQFAQAVENLVKQPIDICPIGPVVGVHVGPGALGIVYYTKEERK
ncbi:EDD domain protein, DegV family [Alkalithermobacter thermoalcaliphilus JW-YL-7 = DSM 7308]|uniref:DegV family protein n=1 Tax=Alkalithermobacter thermoalcaliphilus JW-YL-7 = DSM 7308 TaxID=1121328 RepID=A0A150FNV5_CLOPD|nr:degV family protein [[Clostridium] paradoxum JW-YL-7 = DSM 7308]SHK86167.1 EDD domain protein, DegV family [[Clostridium] paradoxum JW-YL-7 = DSM 7308]